MLVPEEEEHTGVVNFGDFLSEWKDNRGMSTGSGSAGLCNSAWVAHGYGRRRSFRRMKTMGKHSWVTRTQDSFLCTLAFAFQLRHKAQIKLGACWQSGYTGEHRVTLWE